MSNDKKKDEHKDKNEHHRHREKGPTTPRRPQSSGYDRLRNGICLWVVEILKLLPTDAASRLGLTCEMHYGVTQGTESALVRKHNIVFTNPTCIASDLHGLASNDQLTDGGPPLGLELSERVAGPPFREAAGSASRLRCMPNL